VRACWESISQRRFGSGGEGIIEIGSNDVGFIDEAYCWLPGFGVPVLRSPSLTSFFVCTCWVRRPSAAGDGGRLRCSVTVSSFEGFKFVMVPLCSLNRVFMNACLVCRSCFFVSFPQGQRFGQCRRFGILCVSMPQALRFVIVRGLVASLSQCYLYFGAAARFRCSFHFCPYRSSNMGGIC